MMHDSNAFVVSNKKKNSPVKYTTTKEVSWIKPAGFDEQPTQLTTAPETLEEQLEETREAEETVPLTTTTKLFIDGAIEGASKILEDASEIAYNACAPPTASPNGAEEREGVEVSNAASTTTTSGNEVVVKECGGPLSNDAGSNAVNEETTEAPSNVNAETPKTDDEMPTQLNKLSESVSLVSNQTVNGLTTAYVRAGEDLSLVGIALSQSNVAESLSAPIKGEVYYDQENEGEGMEISLDNRVGNSRTVAEI